jgi:hypothetical protein
VWQILLTFFKRPLLSPHSLCTVVALCCESFVLFPHSFQPSGSEITWSYYFIGIKSLYSHSLPSNPSLIVRHNKILLQSQSAVIFDALLAITCLLFNSYHALRALIKDRVFNRLDNKNIITNNALHILTQNRPLLQHPPDQ